MLRTTNDAAPKLEVFVDFGNTLDEVEETTGASLNTWHHYAIIRTSNTVTIFRNGVQTATSTTINGSIGRVGISPPEIGRKSGTTIEELNGYLDEFRVSKGVARWTAAFTPPIHAYGANQRIVSGSVDISGQPAGSNMKYKVETLNEKELKLHGASLLWA